ncbi:MAG TPA: aminotransferase class V-fold PLP-dependent enzyme [Bryobacteraceae bacterium]|nr:aminotransferase class V-fold PLP-dependent enzyme [Bryobacteraceae bacterium]HPQ15900.1 aminotransferase class V-fold PLP-dependent enzyme [Bryobacteraceae bacterium]HPU72484.1 aminotransferase class V-fold PLP-dependent enzyme [Bryobacteraceae bacterium]
MGCDASENLSGTAAPALWEAYRDQFPVTQQAVYLNHAAVAPLSKPAADAMKRLADDALHFGSSHYSEWMETYEGLRLAAARLIGAHRDEIALVKNTSEGIATVAIGLDWRPGDKVVAFQEEFPANYYPWKRLESRGIRVEWLSAFSPLDRIDEACRGARLLAISHVQYLSGYRANLEAIGEICHRRGCLFLVDAIQGLGAFPVDVRKARIHALAADGHKWLLGPEGCGILYIQKDIQDQIEPVEFGWTNVAAYADYASRDMTLRPDAGRYECGTLNTIGCYGLRASVEFLLSVGIDRIAAQVQALGDRIAAGAAAKGYEVLGTRTPETGAGIVSIRKPGQDARLTVRSLKSLGFIAAPRQGWVRLSPHFYISPDDIDRLLAAL